ncbi:acyl-CoA dehydrogenase family protein [Micromonospora sp. WMMD964]|uniref:acyl-CoA dehydrogenase family protein n=1 Tax=Micromonospora sp. WMMD964 TaxID=3016091 RepID=UPI00249B6E71|nr:acyl-CoA dehydrogenase family protein [Micromonospora sp. WMMD964]WFE98681.1 acyl-CoA dehydrogenase family protein [Micromonospora sp. WMMD964]
MTTTDTIARPVTALSERHTAWRDAVRDFAETEVRPLVGEMDAASALDPTLLKKLVPAGLMGIEIPRTYGGAGQDLLAVLIAIEELAAVDPAVAVFVDVQNALVASAVLRHGTGDQKRRYLPRLATGLAGAYAISEEQAGSDAFALTTRAEPRGQGYLLHGRKCWTTSAAEAGLFLVFARVDGAAGGLTAFLVDRDSPGLTVGPPRSKLGIRASSTCDVRLDGVPVGRENVLGRVGAADLLAMETLNVGKLGIAAQLVGLARGALHEALGYAQRREQFGEPIVAYQGVLFPLARLAAELEAARVLLYDAVRVLHHGTPTDRLRVSAMAKYLASEVAERAASQAVETLGGNGFTTAHPVEKLYRDAKVGKIYEGTSNIQFRTIGAILVGAGGERPW